MPSFYELLKYAKTGIASSDMTAYDKMRAIAMAGAKYPVQTITGVPPLSFRSDGSPLSAWSMLGNGQQTGTPSPDNIIMPDFCGKLVGTDWTIPITCAGQTVTVDLSQVQTVRRIKKFVLTGEENWYYDAEYSRFYTIRNDILLAPTRSLEMYCSHYNCIYDGRPIGNVPDNSIYNGNAVNIYFKTAIYTSISEWNTWLAQQYANGTPVTIWYILSTPDASIINEPLCKIGTYADELHSEDAGIVIQTVRGSNTLTVDTDLQPSEMSITGHIKPV